MITTSTHPRQPELIRWQNELADAITTPEALASALGLSPDLIAPARAAAASFRLRVPRSYVARMRRGDPHDPLLRQVLPVAEELRDAPDYGSDPLGEHAALRAPGLLHKYHGRALIITTSACAVHCRYCFRREFPYSEQAGDGEPQHAEATEVPSGVRQFPDIAAETPHTVWPSRWRPALEAIAADESIEEVLLSGGDPLSLSDARLASLTNALSAIRHIRRIRVHTRQPIVLPSRVDHGLMKWLRGVRLPVVFVLHANHPNELDAHVASACARLRESGVTLLNQSVLLKGVNDDVDVLADLSRRLFEIGVLPYYLHALDHVRGAAHFEVEESRAPRIVGDLAKRLPGYLVPRLVREIAGEPAKVTIPPRF